MHIVKGSLEFIRFGGPGIQAFSLCLRGSGLSERSFCEDKSDVISESTDCADLKAVTASETKEATSLTSGRVVPDDFGTQHQTRQTHRLELP